VQPGQNAKLNRSHFNEPGVAVSRPHGKSPQQAASFTRSPKLQEESSLLASVCSLLGVLPRAGAQINPRALANLSRDELLCQTFEVYRKLVADPRITFEHLVFLVTALAGGHELTLARAVQRAYAVRIVRAGPIESDLVLGRACISAVMACVH
jgi:hypothetical protein